jgi:hypothetical protein
MGSADWKTIAEFELFQAVTERPWALCVWDAIYGSFKEP